MLSFWSKKPVVPSTDGRQLHRDARKNGDGVVYASKNQDRGVTFAFSGPVGSRHSDEALKIAGRVYSNENEDENNSKSPRQERRRLENTKSENVQPEAAMRAPASAKKLNKHEKNAAEATDSQGRHKLNAEDAESVFSAAPSDFSQATTSSRRTSVPSEVSSPSSRAPAQVITNRHGVSIGGTGFKHESETQLSYGLQDGGRKLFVSAPKDSREGNTLRQVEKMATKSGVCGIQPSQVELEC